LAAADSERIKRLHPRFAGSAVITGAGVAAKIIGTTNWRVKFWFLSVG
jgi:hypothetical protein